MTVPENPDTADAERYRYLVRHRNAHLLALYANDLKAEKEKLDACIDNCIRSERGILERNNG
jgi:hypothetical protein